VDCLILVIIVFKYGGILLNGKILIVEDEEKLARFLELELNYEGYETEKSDNGRDALTKALDTDFDLILLDLMLPILSGMEVLKKLREKKETPIIILTARDDTFDKVSGLDFGADDYVTKPFEIEELLARIRNILKRKSLYETKKEKTDCISIGDLKIYDKEHIVKFNDEVVELTKKEYDLLLYLCINKNTVISREKIIENVWEFDYYGDTNIVDVYVRYIRSKIDDRFHTKIIYTVRGVGYVVKYEEGKSKNK
jgi:DNA-binding response OmpR family regulator